jgi:hypothetical protein
MVAIAPPHSVAFKAVAVRMDQSLVDFERAFADQIAQERQAANLVQAKVAHRSKQRQVESVNRQGGRRFVLLALALIATAVIVTVVMFKALYLVLGG